jgi:hypothetical protein
MSSCLVLSGAGRAVVVVPWTGAAGSPGVAPPTSMKRFLTLEIFSETDPREVNLGVFDPWEWTGEVRLAIGGPETVELGGAAGGGEGCTRGPLVIHQCYVTSFGTAGGPFEDFKVAGASWHSCAPPKLVGPLISNVCNSRSSSDQYPFSIGKWCPVVPEK